LLPSLQDDGNLAANTTRTKFSLVLIIAGLRRSVVIVMKSTLVRGIAVTLLALLLHAADSKLTPPMQSILDAISADSLRGHISFIAFDALEGRETPSRGLDVSAEYIAAQFRRAGLAPAAGDSYLQTANLLVRGLEHGGRDYQRSDLAEAVQAKRTELPSGTRHSYSNSGFTLLAEIVTRQAGA
jgi:hypothetical protein